MCIGGKDGSASGEKRVARRHTWRNELADSFGELADVSTLQASGYQVIHQHLILRQIQEALAIQFLRLESINKDFGRDDGLGIPGDLVTTPVALKLTFFISSSFDIVRAARPTSVARQFRRAAWKADLANCCSILGE